MVLSPFPQCLKEPLEAVFELAYPSGLQSQFQMSSPLCQRDLRRHQLNFDNSVLVVSMMLQSLIKKEQRNEDLRQHCQGALFKIEHEFQSKHKAARPKAAAEGYENVFQGFDDGIHEVQ